MVLGTVRKHLLGALMEMKNHCENTFVSCGHLKKFLLLPDLKIWKNIAICSLNTVWKFYEKKNGRFLFI